MRCSHLGRRSLTIAAVGTFLSACNGNSVTTTPPALPAANGPPAAAQAIVPARPRVRRGVIRSAGAGKIKHVVIIVQENRSFNNLFYGFPGAKTAKYGYNTSNQKITTAADRARDDWDLDHSSTSFFAGVQRNGKHSRAPTAR